LWKFQKEASPKFSINAVLPTVNMGTIIPAPQSPSDVTGSPGLISAYYNGLATDVTTVGPFMYFVNVENVALAHVRAIERGSETNGERFILAGGPYDSQQIVDILRKHYPERKNIIVEGTPGKIQPRSQTMDGSKATRVLGIEYKDLEPSLIELIESIKHVYN
jgi:nucleoside-diphosphate-sugar epimerase